MTVRLQTTLSDHFLVEMELHKNLSTKSSGLIGSFSFSDLLIPLTLTAIFTYFAQAGGFKDISIPNALLVTFKKII